MGGGEMGGKIVSTCLLIFEDVPTSCKKWNERNEKKKMWACSHQMCWQPLGTTCAPGRDFRAQTLYQAITKI